VNPKAEEEFRPAQVFVSYEKRSGKLIGKIELNLERRQIWAGVVQALFQ